MYKFHIKGNSCEYKNSSYQYGLPVEAIVYANTLDEAIEKVKKVYGYYISTSDRYVIIEEIPEFTHT